MLTCTHTSIRTCYSVFLVTAGVGREHRLSRRTSPISILCPSRLSHILIDFSVRSFVLLSVLPYELYKSNSVDNSTRFLVSHRLGKFFELRAQYTITRIYMYTHWYIYLPACDFCIYISIRTRNSCDDYVQFVTQ